MVEGLPLDAFDRAVAAAFGPNARVTGAERLFGDASSRRYVRVRLAGAPSPTAVVMVLGEGRFAPGSDELGGGAVDELPFVNVARWMARHGFPVPSVHHDASASDGIVLLEDIGDVTLWRAVQDAPATATARFRAAIELLVALQLAGRADPDPACVAFRRRFDGRLARAELAHFVDHGIETRHGTALPPGERAAILDALAPLEAPFRAPDAVLCHRDFMAWNLHVQDDRIRLIDFQDAFLAPDAYDLAALLTDRDTRAVVGSAEEGALIAHFVTTRRAAGWPVPDGFVERYRRCALHRALKVVGRFWFLERVKGKSGYLAYLPSVYGVARRLFDELPELDRARALVVRYVPELAKGVVA